MQPVKQFVLNIYFRELIGFDVLSKTADVKQLTHVGILKKAGIREV
jgi:hypothetical protein